MLGRMTYVLGMVAVLAMVAGTAMAQDRSNVGPIRWMAPESLSRAQVEDLVARGSGLSKADSKRALDGFVDTATGLLSEDGVCYLWDTGFPGADLDGDGQQDEPAFGTLSVVRGAIDNHGCPADNGVDFASGSALWTEDNPLAQESGWQDVPQLEITAPPETHDEGVVVFGRLSGDFTSGDEVCVYRLHSEGLVHRDIAARGAVGGVIVRQGRRVEVVESTSDGGRPIGLLLRGVDASAIEQGMGVNACPATQPARCKEPVAGSGDEAFIKAIASALKRPEDEATIVHDAILSTIAAAVNSGGCADLGDFGRFEMQTILTASVVDPCAGIPENCPPTDPTTPALQIWEMSLDLSGVSRVEVAYMAQQLEMLAERAAEGYGNPQTGKEIKIAAKNVVKFKAGSELSKKVN